METKTKETTVKKTITNMSEKYSDDDLVEMCHTREGWAVAEQLKDLFAGVPMDDDMNDNALEYIADFLEEKGEEETAEPIREYLKTLEEE